MVMNAFLYDRAAHPERPLRVEDCINPCMPDGLYPGLQSSGTILLYPPHRFLQETSMSVTCRLHRHASQLLCPLTSEDMPAFLMTSSLHRMGHYENAGFHRAFTGTAQGFTGACQEKKLALAS
jgi:hypothetical protein